MAVAISSTLLAGLLNDAAASPDREICGLLFGTVERIEDVLPCNNVASDPHDAFEIDPAQLIIAHKAARSGGPQIIGCYHSHPYGPPTPSSRDAAAAMGDGALWLILAEDVARLWRTETIGVLGPAILLPC